MEEIKACMNDIIKKVIKKENNRKWRERNPNYDYNRWHKDIELSRKKDRKNQKKYRARKKENNKKWREKNPNYDRKKKSERWWKDPELSRKKNREYRKAYKLKYA